VSLSHLVMLAGFLITAHAVIANNVPQTLGAFIASNRDRPPASAWRLLQLVSLAASSCARCWGLPSASRWRSACPFSM
jgi:hypothetical protein